MSKNIAIQTMRVYCAYTVLCRAKDQRTYKNAALQGHLMKLIVRLQKVGIGVSKFSNEHGKTDELTDFIEEFFDKHGIPPIAVAVGVVYEEVFMLRRIGVIKDATEILALIKPLSRNPPLHKYWEAFNEYFSQFEWREPINE